MPLGPTVGTLDWTFYAYAMYQNKYTITEAQFFLLRLNGYGNETRWPKH